MWKWLCWARPCPDLYLPQEGKYKSDLGSGVVARPLRKLDMKLLARALITKYWWLGGFKNRNLFLAVLKVESPRPKFQPIWFLVTQFSLQLVDSHLAVVSLNGVIVNFMYHLTWAKGYADGWLNMISGGVCKGVSRIEEHLNWWRLSTIQSFESLNKTKRTNLFSAWAEIPIFFCTGTLACGSSAFRLRLNYITHFPGFPACRWEIMVLLGLHKYMSQSSTQCCTTSSLPPSLPSLYLFSVFCFLGVCTQREYWALRFLFL